tara:strand:+ start:46692 stop:46982 length:291 start_codon:yes stop_codon:yes gene_type:complete
MLVSLRDISDSLLNQLSKLLNKKSDTPEMEKAFLDRIEKCLSCNDLKEKKIKAINIEKAIKICNQCKCIFPYFVFAHRKKCPIGKWGPINTDQTDT